jgi:amino acid transporter
MAEDGMMPSWFVKVHPKYGTPWVAILVASAIFSILSLSTFAVLVVLDVLLNMIALMLQFLALWKLRFSHKHVERTRVPGGWVGLVLITVAPLSIIVLAIVSQVSEEGMQSIWMGLIAIAIGVGVYFLNRKFVKPGIPDIDPWVIEGEEK